MSRFFINYNRKKIKIKPAHFKKFDHVFIIDPLLTVIC